MNQFLTSRIAVFLFLIEPWIEHYLFKTVKKLVPVEWLQNKHISSSTTTKALPFVLAFFFWWRKLYLKATTQKNHKTRFLWTVLQISLYNALFFALIETLWFVDFSNIVENTPGLKRSSVCSNNFLSVHSCPMAPQFRLVERTKPYNKWFFAFRAHHACEINLPHREPFISKWLLVFLSHSTEKWIVSYDREPYC